ncbi:TetR/AcrR family transcriptional regulator [Sinorhizobium alkalisoli]|uniref:TetR/AcrR family transcriptional regulator n=1 Tax=Sinorhizobium alkalisoli TaxID=1752398 RepID=UPI00124E80F4|nr:TetR/AcrR family transcriptional regulator [Sinorhizobium alkalisoli]
MDETASTKAAVGRTGHGSIRGIREFVAPGGPEQEEGVFFGAAVASTKGRERVRQILDEALNIIVADGFEGLTLRSVARGAKITIGNLQHYFATHDDLLRATTRYILHNYLQEYDRLADLHKGDALHQFEATMRFLIEDCKDPRTNAIFFSLWALAQRNSFASEMMDLMYCDHRQSIEKQLAAINPHMPKDMRPIRAALIAVQIEGLMLLIAANRPKHAELRGIEEECLNQILRLAHSSE